MGEEQSGLFVSTDTGDVLVEKAAQKSIKSIRDSAAAPSVGAVEAHLGPS